MMDDMRSDSLSKELKHVLAEAGAELVGIGDMSEIPQSPFPIGIAVVVPLPAEIVRPLKDMPTKEYFEIYHQLNHKLDTIVRRGEEFLITRGYHALAQTTKVVKVDKKTKVTPVPHKTVATRSGLGWIGKNCLLVTEEYGAAVRISSLFTDAPLICSQSVDVSLCGECQLCVDACPGHALTGVLWKKGLEREQMVDVQKCYRKQKEIMFESTGIDCDLCGKCFAVCRITQKYLEAHSTL